METSVRLPRLAASAIGVAIVAASALALAAPASAATSDVTFVTAGDINEHPSTDGMPGWVEYSIGTLTSSVAGLTTPLGSEFAYGLTPYLDATTGTAVSDLLGDSSVSGLDDTTLHPEVAFYDGTSSFAYIRSAVAGGSNLADPATGWYLYSDIGNLDADSTYSLETIELELAGNIDLVAWTIASFGFSLDAPTTLYSATVNGSDFSFMPEPISSAPTTLTVAQYGSTGITVTTSGFLPNETGIIVGLGNGGTGGPIGTVDADAQGVITYTYIEPSPEIGSYRLSFFGSVSADQFFDFSVTATAAAAAALAATGTDSFAPVVVGGVLLLGGAALAIVAIKRRRTA
jgi:hypothetical protein